MADFKIGETVQTTMDITIDEVTIPKGTHLVIKESTGALTQDSIEAIYKTKLINIPKSRILKVAD